LKTFAELRSSNQILSAYLMRTYHKTKNRYHFWAIIDTERAARYSIYPPPNPPLHSLE